MPFVHDDAFEVVELAVIRVGEQERKALGGGDERGRELSALF